MKDMPKAVNVYITSEMNSYGIHSSRWKEGEELVGMVTNKKSLETINDHRRILSKMQLQTQFSFNNLTKNSWNWIYRIRSDMQIILLVNIFDKVIKYLDMLTKPEFLASNLLFTNQIVQRLYILFLEVL